MGKQILLLMLVSISWLRRPKISSINHKIYLLISKQEFRSIQTNGFLSALNNLPYRFTGWIEKSLKI